VGSPPGEADDSDLSCGVEAYMTADTRGYDPVKGNYPINAKDSA